MVCNVVDDYLYDIVLTKTYLIIIYFQCVDIEQLTDDSTFLVEAFVIAIIFAAAVCIILNYCRKQRTGTIFCQQKTSLVSYNSH